MRRIATHEYIGQAQWALDVMVRALPLYEQVFDIEYPLPKLDLLIVRLPFLPLLPTY
jgi:aminopeptidase 2